MWVWVRDGASGQHPRRRCTCTNDTGFVVAEKSQTPQSCQSRRIVRCEGALQLVVGRRAAVGAHRVEPRRSLSSAAVASEARVGGDPRSIRATVVGGPWWRPAARSPVERAVLRAERLVALLRALRRASHLALLLQAAVEQGGASRRGVEQSETRPIAPLAFSRSMRRSEVIPSRQPQMTPAVADSVPTTRTRCNPRCAGLRLNGRAQHQESVDALPKSVHAVSETTCPYAAAVSVERPSVTPSCCRSGRPLDITMLSIGPAGMCARRRNRGEAQNRGDRVNAAEGFEPRPQVGIGLGQRLVRSATVPVVAADLIACAAPSPIIGTRERRAGEHSRVGGGTAGRTPPPRCCAAGGEPRDRADEANRTIIGRCAGCTAGGELDASAAPSRCCDLRSRVSPSSWPTSPTSAPSASPQSLSTDLANLKRTVRASRSRPTARRSPTLCSTSTRVRRGARSTPAQPGAAMRQPAVHVEQLGVRRARPPCRRRAAYARHGQPAHGALARRGLRAERLLHRRPQPRGDVAARGPQLRADERDDGEPSQWA